ncbi:MAG: hypothetical protein U9R27_09290 [Campylobacterota bacterium]|nr:hypothetical protein [Campylobacterota bacterium]
MTKQLLISLLVFSSLHAEDISPEELNSIYIEAILFVTVFGLMSVASFFISRRHARQNALKESLKRSQDEIRENSQTTSSDKPNDSSDKTTRVEELSKMLNDGLITDEEFQTLKSVSK